MQLEFNKELIAQNLITLENNGHFAIEAINEDGYFFYVIVQTALGETTILTCGPQIPDVPQLPDSFHCDILRIPFSEKKISGIISGFLNNRLYKINEAKEISVEDASNQLRNLKEYILTDWMG